MVQQGLNGGWHQCRERRSELGYCVQRVVGREARMNGDRRTKLQRGRRLDIEPANMKEWQHRQHVIITRHRVHVLAHDTVPQQRFLREHGTLRSPGGSGSVDDQHRRSPIDMRFPCIAATCRNQIHQRCTAFRCIIQPDNHHFRQSYSKRFEHRIERAPTNTAFTEASVRTNICSGTARRQFSGTSIAPSRAQAYSSTR